MKTIGEKIKTCRKSKGMTQAMLGKKLNVTDACIRAWESGKSLANLNTISKIANALDVHPITLLPDWFLFGGYE